MWQIRASRFTLTVVCLCIVLTKDEVYIGLGVVYKKMSTELSAIRRATTVMASLFTWRLATWAFPGDIASPCPQTVLGGKIKPVFTETKVESS